MSEIRLRTALQCQDVRVLTPEERSGNTGKKGGNATPLPYRTMCPDDVDTLVACVEVHLRARNFPAAMTLIKQAAAKERIADAKALRPQDTPLAAIVPTRIANFLERRFGYLLAGHVLYLQDGDTRLRGRGRGMGPDGLRQLDEGLAKLGLRRRCA